jgi:hypothetical protein
MKAAAKESCWRNNNCHHLKKAFIRIKADLDGKENGNIGKDTTKKMYKISSIAHTGKAQKSSHLYINMVKCIVGVAVERSYRIYPFPIEQGARKILFPEIKRNIYCGKLLLLTLLNMSL